MSPRWQITHGAGRAALGGAVSGYMGGRQFAEGEERAKRDEARQERGLAIDERRVGAVEDRNNLEAMRLEQGQRMKRAATELQMLLNLPPELARLAPGIRAAGERFGGDSIDGVSVFEGMTEQEFGLLGELDPEDQSRYLADRAEKRVNDRREQQREQALRMLNSGEFLQGGSNELPPEVLTKLVQDVSSAKGRDLDAAIGSVQQIVDQEQSRRADERDMLETVEDLEARALRLRETLTSSDGALSIQAEEAIDAERKRLLGLADDVRFGKVTPKQVKATLRGMGGPGAAPTEMGPGRADDEVAGPGYFGPPAEDPGRAALANAASGSEPGIGGPGGVSQMTASAETPRPQVAPWPVPDELAGEVSPGGPAGSAAGGASFPKPRPLAQLAKDHPGLEADFIEQLDALFLWMPDDAQARLPQLAGLVRAYGVDPRDPEVQKAIRAAGSAAQKKVADEQRAKDRKAQQSEFEPRQFGDTTIFRWGYQMKPWPGTRPKEGAAPKEEDEPAPEAPKRRRNRPAPNPYRADSGQY